MKFEEIDTSSKKVLGKGSFGKVVEWDKDKVVKIINQDMRHLVSLKH